MIPLALGLAVVIGALAPWSDAAADRSLTAHMLQHVALTELAAPLLVLGLPAGRILRALPRSAARRVLRVANPAVCWIVFVAVQWATHFSGFYELAASKVWAHALEHGLYLGTALFFWWPVLGRPASLRGIGRVFYVVLAMPPLGLIGVVLAASGSVRYPHYASLADQHSAGALLWVASTLLMVGALLLAAWDWLQTEERRAVAREAYLR